MSFKEMAMNFAKKHNVQVGVLDNRIEVECDRFYMSYNKKHNSFYFTRYTKMGLLEIDVIEEFCQLINEYKKEQENG